MQTFFELLPEKQNTSAALGFFDGLHIGHRKVIGEAVRGSENGLVPICFTFAQSPKSVLKNQPQEALMSVEDKKTVLSEIGIQHLYMCDFKSVVDVAPQKFVEDMLIKTLKAKKLCCGFNYTFGKNGEGNTELLAKICKENGIELRVVDRWYPSSKTCHCCGAIRKDLKLSDRIFECDCGYIEDRDFNAALNLRDATTYEVA